MPKTFPWSKGREQGAGGMEQGAGNGVQAQGAGLGNWVPTFAGADLSLSAEARRA